MDRGDYWELDCYYSKLPELMQVIDDMNLPGMLEWR